MESVEKFVFMLFCFQKQRKQPEITSSACLKILYVQTLLKMPFSSEQEKLIILLFGRFQSSTQVRREFIKHQNLKGRQASELRTQDFDWIIKKFMKNGIKNQKKTPGPRNTSQRTTRIRHFFDTNPKEWKRLLLFAL